MNTSSGSSFTRRQFVGGTLAAAAVSSLGLAIPSRAADAKQKINIGIVGVGGRGSWIADLFVQHGGYNFVAIADYFADRANAAGDHLGVPAERRFTGLSGYKRLLEQKLDAVVIQSPPYFHPEQAAAAVAAGKHVYVAKPIAVDVPGCLTIEESGRLATQKKLAFLVDFQTRATNIYQQIEKRIREGQLGKIISAEANYQTGPVGEGTDQARRADPKNQELRLRSWVTDKVLSGDIITEQNIHALDVATWLLNAAPISAIGTCGKDRDFIGDCFDHFSVIFNFPNDIPVTFSSKQAGWGYDDIMCRVYGMTGFADTHYGSKCKLRSKDDAVEADTPDIYEAGARTNIATFHSSICSGDYANPTVAPSVRSNLTTILGRTASYEKRLVTWEEMLKTKPLVADLSGLKA